METSNSNLTPQAALKSIAALGDLDSAVLSKLAAQGMVQSFEEGTMLFSEGEHHDRLYFVCSGLVRLDMVTPASGRQTILSVGSGDLLAWSSLIGDGIMTATAIAMEDTLCVTFKAAQLKRVLEVDTAFGYEVMKIVSMALSRRLLATRLQLLDLYRA